MVLAVNFLSGGNWWKQLPARGLATLTLSLLAICGVGWFFALGRIAKAKRKYHSFELTFTPDGMLRKQDFVPDLFISYSDLGSVQVLDGKGAALRRKSDGTLLWIADELENYREVLDILRPHATSYVERSAPPLWARPWLSLTITLFGWALLLISTRFATALAGAGCIALILGFDVWKLRYSAGMDKVQKRQIWLIPIVGLVVLLKFLSLTHR
jgi:hypothetical protein